MATSIPATDAEIITGLRARDRECWAQLFSAYAPRLRAFGYRLTGNSHDADDLVQETFVRAVPRLDQLDPESADVGAYLFATLRNTFLKQVARSGRQQPVAEVPEPRAAEPSAQDPEPASMLAHQREEVRLANSRLEPRQRLVLALRELDNRSYAEIAAMVGIKENAVAQLIFRARASLRTEMRLAQIDPLRLPVACRRFLPMIAAHLDGQLSGARRDETMAHLEACERCQEVLASMREASNRYRALLLPALLADHLGDLDEERTKTEIDRRLDGLGYWSSTSGRRLSRRSRSAVAAAAAIGVFVVGSVALGDSGERVGATVSPVPAARQSPSIPGLVSAPTFGSVSVGSPVISVSPPAISTTSQAPSKPSTSPPPPSSGAPAPTGPAVPKALSTAPPKPVSKLGQGPVKSAAVTAKPPAAAPPAVKPTAKLPSVAPPARTLAPASSIPATAAPTTSAPAAPEPVSPDPVTPTPESPAPASPAPETPAPDTTAPTVTISSAPPATTTDTNANFSFVASEPVTFECALDGAAYTACVSPAEYTSLVVGAHSFGVRGIDAAGNTGLPATSEWAVAAPLPDLYIASFSKNVIMIGNRGQLVAGPSVLTITLIGTFTVPSLAPGSVATFTWSICRVGTYTAIVDRTNAVLESDEANNSSSRSNTCP